MTTTPGAPDPEAVGLSTNARGSRVPNAWRRAAGRVRLEDPFVGWSAAIAVTLLSLFLRLWKLGTPKEFEFDETYYAKDAWSLLHYGYARQPLDGDLANNHILAGHTTGSQVWQNTPEMVVHPEVGKWLIALGEGVFGMTPFGWRISAAIVGSLMILVMCRLARRLTGSTALGLVAGLLLSFDGLELVLSRLALLDIFLAFFILCGTACLVNDRDWHRAKMARLVPEQITSRRSWGPVRRLLFRPWLLIGGVCWGLACGTKWEAIYPLAALGILNWLWASGARRSFGVRWPVVRSALTDGLSAFVHLVGVGLVVYIASWGGWLMHANVYEANLSATQYTQFVSEGHCQGTTAINNEDPKKHWSTRNADDHGIKDLPGELKSLWFYHHDVYEFHTHFLNCATHPYASKPSAWPLINRPVGVSVEDKIQPNTEGCTAVTGSTCIKQVLLIGTPVLWWGGVGALLFSLVMWIGARDWRFGLAAVGFAAGWLPWLMYDARPIFSFYMITAVPFMVLAVTLTMGRLIGLARTSSRRRTTGIVLSGAFFVLVLVNFAWFWPIFTDGLLTHSAWTDRIWFVRWI